jgi:hypothetical protein
LNIFSVFATLIVDIQITIFQNRSKDSTL